MNYHLCNECATAIMNDDYSGVEDDTDYPRIIAFVESHGMLALGDESDFGGGYWECESCQQVCIGTGRILEDVN